MIDVTAVPALIPSPDINSLQLGPLQIRFYALCILTGIVLAVIITRRRLRAAGHAPAVAVDIAIWAVPLGIVGARIYHVLTHPGDYFFPGADLLRVFSVWEGGIAIFGAILGGLVGILIGARRARLPMLVFLDALAPGMLIAQAAGRLGNYFNQELFGPPTRLPWGLQIDPGNPAIPAGTPAGTLFHPLFLYELLWNFAGAAVIVLIERRLRARQGPAVLGTGISVGIYLLWYGTGRAALESIRLDPTELLTGGIKANVLTAVVVVALGIGLLVRAQAVRRRVGTARLGMDGHVDPE